MNLYQDKLTKYEKDREIWEKQMKQMKTQIAGLESSLEEKENFIKQYIKQPLSPYQTYVQPENQPSTQPSPSSEEESVQTAPQPMQQTQQQADWFQRMVSQQQGVSQQAQKTQNSTATSTTMDFFTLRSKTTQPASNGPSYGSQWNQ
jgi:hypothetical protein